MKMTPKFGLTANDLSATRAVSIELVSNNLLPSAGVGPKMPIQFPPKVTADAKKSKWGGSGKNDDTYAWEPIRVWKGADARAITIELKYVVTDSGGFNGPKIMKISREFKRVHYGQARSVGEIFFWKINMYDSIVGGGSDPASFICMSTDVKYSNEMVNSGGFFPLITTITIAAELATRVVVDGGKPKMDIQDGIKGQPPTAWY